MKDAVFRIASGHSYACSVTRYPFADAEQEIGMYQESWKYGCEREGVDIPLSPRTMKKLEEFVSEQRDRTLKVIRRWTYQRYGLSDTKTAVVEDARKIHSTSNAELASSLLEEHRFTCKDVKTGEAPFQHEIILHVIQEHWFAFNSSVGDRHMELFCPVSISLLAYILTMVESCIKEHLPGVQRQGSFNPNNYRARFEFFSQEIERFSCHPDSRAASFNSYMEELNRRIRIKRRRMSIGAKPRFDHEICGGDSSD